MVLHTRVLVFPGTLDWERMWEETGWSVEGAGRSEHPRDSSEIDGWWDEDISSYSDDSNLNSPEIGRQKDMIDGESIETFSVQSDGIELDASVDLSPLASGVLMDRETRRNKLLKKDWGTEVTCRRKNTTKRRKQKIQTSTPLLQRRESGVSLVDCSVRLACTCTGHM